MKKLYFLSVLCVGVLQGSQSCEKHKQESLGFYRNLALQILQDRASTDQIKFPLQVRRTTVQAALAKQRWENTKNPYSYALYESYKKAAVDNFATHLEKMACKNDDVLYLPSYVPSVIAFPAKLDEEISSLSSSHVSTSSDSGIAGKIFDGNMSSYTTTDSISEKKHESQSGVINNILYGHGFSFKNSSHDVQQHKAHQDHIQKSLVDIAQQAQKTVHHQECAAVAIQKIVRGDLVRKNLSQTIRQIMYEKEQMSLCNAVEKPVSISNSVVAQSTKLDKTKHRQSKNVCAQDVLKQKHITNDEYLDQVVQRVKKEQEELQQAKRAQIIKNLEIAKLKQSSSTIFSVISQCVESKRAIEDCDARIIHDEIKSHLLGSEELKKQGIDFIWKSAFNFADTTFKELKPTPSKFPHHFIWNQFLNSQQNNKILQEVLRGSDWCKIADPSDEQFDYIHTAHKYLIFARLYELHRHDKTELVHK